MKSPAAASATPGGERDEDMASQTSTQGGAGSDSEKVLTALAIASEVPSGRDPGDVFVCGIGNRLTDTAAYAAVGVPPCLNLLIDERSILRSMDGGCPASFDGYLSLLPHIQRLLPSLDAQGNPINTGLGGKGTCPFDCDCDLLVL